MKKQEIDSLTYQFYSNFTRTNQNNIEIVKISLELVGGYLRNHLRNFYKLFLEDTIKIMIVLCAGILPIHLKQHHVHPYLTWVKCICVIDIFIAKKIFNLLMFTY